jgi:uncharacterized protein
MKLPALLIVGVAGVLALLAAGCAGDTVVHTEGSTATGISVTGTGRAYGTPDVANVQIGVSVQADTVAAARESAARSLQAVIDSVRQNGVDQRDIRTTQFSVEPQYDFSNRAQTIIGYRVTNVLNVTIRNIDNTSRIIDGALRAGGNDTVVRNIAFTVSDPAALQNAAREDAMRQARARADALARLGGVSLGRPISIQESDVPDLRFPAAERAAMQDETPIQPGELEIRVTVNVLYAINQ